MSNRKFKHPRRITEQLSEAQIIGNQKIDAQLIEYNNDDLSQTNLFNRINFERFNDKTHVHWMNLHGIENKNPVQIICTKLGIHDLVLEDILDINQRPKLQEFEKYLLFSVKSVIPNTDNGLQVEQISFILAQHYLLSFQEQPRNYFKDIRLRLKEKKGIVRERGADYLLFLLLDAILDNYFDAIEKMEERINNTIRFTPESDPKPDLIFKIETLKNDVLVIKKYIEPFKTAILNIENDQDFIQERHNKYFSELKDQCNQILDEANTLYHQLESSNYLFFSLQGYKMNQIMKTLTIIATIFIPLTFIVGVYGMNFDFMPELRFRWGYFAVWGVMASAIILMIVYFKIKKWF